MSDSHRVPMGRSEMFGYGVGDLACGLIWNTVAMFLMFYYTEVFGISAAAAGTMLLFARIIDGFGDIGVGLWVDRTRTKMGSCRPFLLFGAPVLACMAVACFYVPALSPEAKLAYAGITYTLMMLAYSLVNVPYGALPVLMTPSSEQRTRLAGSRMALAAVGWMIVGGATMPLVGVLGGGDRQTGYFLTIALFALLAMLLLWLCFATTRERVPPENGHKVVTRDMRAVLKSRAWWAMALATMSLYVGLMMPAGGAVYYFTYVVKQPEIVSLFFVVGNVGNLIGIFWSDRLTRRFCKLKVMRWIMVPSGLLPLIYLFVDPALTWQVFALGFVIAISALMAGPIFFSMVADVADSIELESGQRVAGLVGSALSLAVKVGSGLASAITGFILSGAGYRSGVEQTPEAAHGIVLCMSVGPCVAYFVTLVVLQWYPYSKPQINAMQDRLSLRRAQASAA